MTKPSRYSASRRFRDLKVGDFAYSIHHNGKDVWARVERVVSVWPGGPCGGLFKTLPCYSDGSPMIYFGMWFRQRSGVEYGDNEFRPPTDRPRVRLYLELPEGVHAVSRPQREAA